MPTEKNLGEKAVERLPSTMQLGVTALPTIPKDQSDRNRTSAFAFTGNKFEFRAVGSSASPARASLVLNTIIAESLEKIADEIETAVKAGQSLGATLHGVVVRNLKEHKRAVFNGNGYTQEWVDEAARRGLPNLKSAPEAIKELMAEKNVKVFEEMKVLTRHELQAHQNVFYEEYIKTINIEAKCLHNLAATSVLPACLEYKKSIKDSIDKEIPAQASYLKKVDDGISDLMVAADQLKAAFEEAERKFTEEELHEHSMYMKEKVLEQGMARVRKICDAMEDIVDNKLWPIAKYGEILYRK